MVRIDSDSAPKYICMKLFTSKVDSKKLCFSVGVLCFCDLLRKFTGLPPWMSTVPSPLSHASVSISAGFFGSKCASWTELTITFLTSNSSCISLVQTKGPSFFKRLRIRNVPGAIGNEGRHEIYLPEKLWNSCLPLGAA